MKAEVIKTPGREGLENTKGLDKVMMSTSSFLSFALSLSYLPNLNLSYLLCFIVFPLFLSWGGGILLITEHINNLCKLSIFQLILMLAAICLLPHSPLLFFASCALFLADSH